MKSFGHGKGRRMRKGILHLLLSSFGNKEVRAQDLLGPSINSTRPTKHLYLLGSSYLANIFVYNKTTGKISHFLKTGKKNAKHKN